MVVNVRFWPALHPCMVLHLPVDDIFSRESSKIGTYSRLARAIHL